MRLSNLVPGLSEKYLISCFISGLKEPNRYEVMVKEPTTMKSAIRLALTEEDKATAISKSSRKHTSKEGWNKNVEKKLLYKLLQFRKIATMTLILLKGLLNSCLAKEYKEKREKGLCLFCDGKYVAGRRCKNQKIYKVEVSIESNEESIWPAPLQEESSDEETLSLTTNAMEGTLGVSVIWLVGKIHGKEVGFMVAHNFIDLITIARLQLEVAQLTPSVVTVAGGEKFKGKEFVLMLQFLYLG